VLTEDIKALFEEVLAAYVSSASAAAIAEMVGDNGWEDEVYNVPEYQYELSRVNTKAEEWRAELDKLLNGKA
jgi:hypothetical protein